MELTFSQFFQSLHGYDPFPWQASLAEQIVKEGKWPQVLDLPTGSGKTSCLDIAVYAMFSTLDAPRRVFFVVDRRVVVNEAYERMREVARKIQSSKDPILEHVCQKLQSLSGSSEALRVIEMRGGVYRDASWVNNPLQRTIVLSTVDQVGSRLLFRGYGVSPQVRSIHAALIANDSLLILDEAHCSRPFSETLGRVTRFMGTEAKFQVVEMSATPSAERVAFTISDADRKHAVLSRRLHSAKKIRLVQAKSRTDQSAPMAKELVATAIQLQKQTGHRRIAIMANRIATAKAAKALLDKQEVSSLLLIGRMRPLDRDDVLAELEPFRTGEGSNLESPKYVVSTQCLEVGADLDFEVLVTEAASIDALLQRFGRLDRNGKLQGLAAGAILFGPTKVDKPDPIYGLSIDGVRNWLMAFGTDQVDFGIEGQESLTIPQLVRQLPDSERDKLRQPTKHAAVLLPAHLDALAQTGPEPEPSPDVSLFLHGSADAAADVQLIWRADLPEDLGAWRDILALCPPGSAEAMPVRYSAFRDWASEDVDADIEGIAEVESGKRKSALPIRSHFVWQGNDSLVRRVRPGDTVVLRCEDGGWDHFGHIPESGLDGRAPLDFGDRANFQQRRQAILRLSPELVAQWQPTTDKDEQKKLQGRDDDPPEIETILEVLRKHVDLPGISTWLAKMLRSAINAKGVKLRRYPPIESGAQSLSYVLTWLQNRTSIDASVSNVDEEAGSDELSFVGVNTLEGHTKEVVRFVTRFAEQSEFREALIEAAAWHDLGKADERFQAFLHGGDALRAALAPRLLAKGGEFRRGMADKAQLPKGFRHEMLSLAAATSRIETERADRDLILHLIASHHGHARPFAPVVLDHAPRPASFADKKLTVEDQRLPAHSLASGVARRFWTLTRKMGWWRLAYLEAQLRLADWTASSIQEDR